MAESAESPTLRPATLDQIRAAAARIRPFAVRTPLVRLHTDVTAAEIWLKLENLQPIGSFKIRGAANALLSAPAGAIDRGVYTASAGNMAQGVGWMARAAGVPWSVVVPDHAPRTKLDAIDRLGGRIIAAPFDDWWRVIVEHTWPGLDGHFIHPVSDPGVIAGNATIGLEILEDLPDVDTVIVPFGGGGLSCGIASALREIAPRVKVFAAEVETAAAFRGALQAGAPATVDYTPSFVDGIGSRRVLDAMWPLARELLAGSIVVSLAAAADAVRLLAERNRIIAEGAAGAAVAAALAESGGAQKIVCIISGGNIDAARLASILTGNPP